jgi:hypothetical protein
VDEIARDRSWFEAKVLRQYLHLFGEAVGVARDVASIIAIQTRQLAVQFAAEPAFIDLCQRAFHSYLRLAINARDPRTAYFVMQQYRLVAEALLDRRLESAVIEAARRMRFYGELAEENGLPFLLEVAAYDLAQLVEAAADDPTMRDRLLEIVLTMGHRGSTHLKGVRRVQIQLATLFLLRGETGPVSRIATELALESETLLEEARSEIEQESSAGYWEITDRGANFAFLPVERRARLAPLFQTIDSLRAR